MPVSRARARSPPNPSTRPSGRCARRATSPCVTISARLRDEQDDGRLPRWRRRRSDRCRAVRCADPRSGVERVLAPVGAARRRAPLGLRARGSRRRGRRRRARRRIHLGLAALSDLAALDAVTAAIESGAGLPEVVRAAGRALGASLAVTDAWGATLAVAARSPAEERSLLTSGKGVLSVPLRVADSAVGTLHVRFKEKPSASMQRLLATIIASEVERIRAPERVSESAAADFLRAVLGRELTARDELLSRAADLSLALQDGACMIVAHASPQAPTDEGWRGRVRAIAERGAKAVASRSIAALSERDGFPGAEVLVLVPGGEEQSAARAADAVLREMQASLAGFTFTLGRSR